MPGDYDMKFAGLRTLLAYMYLHPGKKLLFMGAELGQFNEWHYESQLDWQLLDYDKHRCHKRFVQELNLLYKSTPALYELDNNWDGFRWSSCENFEENIIVFVRRDSRRMEIIGAFNFAPVPRRDYRIGLEGNEVCFEVMSTDEKRFGGQGMINSSPLYPERREWNGFEYSIRINLPPMSAVILRQDRKKKAKGDSV